MGGPFHREFLRRVERIPVHGLGLSIDIHAPEFTSLLRSLRVRQVPPAYFEVFHTQPAALYSVRRQVEEGLLTYHGEGLWLTQPEMTGSWAERQEVDDAIAQLQVLQSAWLNHECATKYLAGYSYGTYLPPLYTRSSAEVVAENTRQIQTLLDDRCRLLNGSTPLLLLEMPPLTYFLAGTLPIPTFFQVVTELAPCGLVLDIGHLWTVFRYSGAYRANSLANFVQAFLEEFPLDRVVEIHVAGLAIHESQRAASSSLAGSACDGALPAWTDAHAAPIPSVLFEMLDQILSHPRLTNLKGLALEVDTKPEELIVEEFAEFTRRYSTLLQSRNGGNSLSPEPERNPIHEQAVSIADKQALEEAYDRYARALVGGAEPLGEEWCRGQSYFDEVDRYRRIYLPYEILHWGGKVEDMFPKSSRRLKEIGVRLAEFVPFWFHKPQPLTGVYDFFLLKIERFVEFVRDVAPEVQDIAQREAEELRQGYRIANAPLVSTQGSEL